MPEIGPREFPGVREYMGTIEISGGKTYKVYMPIVYDFTDIILKDADAPFRLAAKSIGISYSEFQLWTLPDANRVVAKVSKALEILYPEV